MDAVGGPQHGERRRGDLGPDAIAFHDDEADWRSGR
jgi:hypothetical protein